MLDFREIELGQNFDLRSGENTDASDAACRARAAGVELGNMPPLITVELMSSSICVVLSQG